MEIALAFIFALVLSLLFTFVLGDRDAERAAALPAFLILAIVAGYALRA
jgi:hypothetical protein